MNSMNVTVINTVEVLDIAKQCRPREIRVSVTPGNYELIEIPNPYAPGVRFFALPDTMSGAVSLWWWIQARYGFVKINSSDKSGSFDQEQVFNLIKEAVAGNCSSLRKIEIFKLLFPEFSEKDRIFQNPELARSFVGGVLYNLLFDNKSDCPEDACGLIPVIVAAICERTGILPFATVDWKGLRRHTPS